MITSSESSQLPGLSFKQTCDQNTIYSGKEKDQNIVRHQFCTSDVPLYDKNLCGIWDLTEIFSFCGNKGTQTLHHWDDALHGLI